MSRRVRKLTPLTLKRMIQQEARKIQKEISDPVAKGGAAEDIDAEEVDAEDLAGTLEKDIDYIKALKIHEAKLVKKLKRIKEAKSSLRKRIARRV